MDIVPEKKVCSAGSGWSATRWIARARVAARRLAASGLAALGVTAPVLVQPALAQSFTISAEVKPILELTRANWLAVAAQEGQDLLYFTQIESWRCGIAEIRYSINSGAANTIRETEPCYHGTAQPNAIKADGHLPFISLPPGTVRTISVVLRFDDGTELRGDFERAAILLP